MIIRRRRLLLVSVILLSDAAQLSAYRAITMVTRADCRQRRAEGVNRKEAVWSSTVVPALALLVRPSPARAVETGREALAKVQNMRSPMAASFLPGYGQPDVYYPAYFEGTWQNGADPEPDVLAEAQRRVGETVTFPVRFSTYGEQGGVVADRGFNAANLWKARYSDKDDLYWDAIVPSWSPSNPNILTVSLPEGLTIETKVTKRSFEEPSADTFGSTEYCRVAEARQDIGLGSVPQLRAIRTLTRFRRRSVDEIEGLELVKYYPTVSLSTDPPAYLTVKSRLTFKRL